MAAKFTQEVKIAHRDTLAESLRYARQLSSGRRTAAQLRRLGHPYRRGGSGLGDPAIINIRTGRFRRSWRATEAVREGGAFVSKIQNIAPQAALFRTGTRRMMARPIQERVEAHLAAIHARRARAAAQAAIRM
jgi:hypothetical protein